MIAETREKFEHKENMPSELLNAIQVYMRTEFSPEVFHNTEMSDAAKVRIAIKAKDWCMKHNCEMPDDQYKDCAEQSINTFLKNWENKKPGEDNRSHNLGKMLPR